MRVAGGTCKGKTLSSFKGQDIRPTSDKVREAVFNILSTDFARMTVLDVFAGTGAMGIEALSRGAKEAIFIDNSAASVEVIKKNLGICGLSATSAKILKKDALGALRMLSGCNARFDVIFIDPPYASSIIEDVLKAIADGGLLSADGVIVAETSKRAKIGVAPSGLECVDERKYGDTLVYFFRGRQA